MVRLLAVALVIGVSGCAGADQPIIDTKGVDMTKYQQDLTECQAYANQVSPASQGATGAVIGGGLGAVLGVITGAFTGDVGTGAALGASVGGVAGGASGLGQGAASQHQIVDNCLLGRGYHVLN